jgi:hypothetical protein
LDLSSIYRGKTLDMAEQRPQRSSTTIVCNEAMAVLVMEGTTVMELLVWMFATVHYALDTD